MAKTNLHQVLADNVRRYHARIGISQDNFAIECGVHRAFVGSQPADDSESGSVLPIQVILKKSSSLVALLFQNAGPDLGRHRRTELDVCQQGSWLTKPRKSPGARYQPPEAAANIANK